MQNTVLQDEKTIIEVQRRWRPQTVWLRHIATPLVLLLLLGIWQIIAMLQIYPSFIIPSPQSVAEKFYEVLLDGRLWLHTSTTLSAVVSGLLLGVLCGIVLGYLIAKSTVLESVLSPLIIGVQSTPIVAYAPLLVIWFGSGPTSKIVTSTLIVFFPTLMNTVVGVRTVPQSLRDLMRVHRATQWQMFTKLEVPAAMPVLLSGLKISATLAVIGAVVGEFVSANAGLGFLITLARSQYDTALVIVAVLMLALIARTLYGLVSLLERYLLRWRTH
ncbi:MAG: ABC transporter permease [Anaerolineae bacterium]|nr:ABC transporter permease [Anaerolineae bacterium]